MSSGENSFTGYFSISTYVAEMPYNRTYLGMPGGKGLFQDVPWNFIKL